MFPMFSKYSGVAMVALLAGSQAFAQTDALKPTTKIQAIAACQTISQKLEDLGSDEKVEAAQTDLDLCRSAIGAAYQVLRKKGSESFQGGIGMFKGVEINTPNLMFNRVSVSARAAAGGVVFLTADNSLRVAPMLNVVPVGATLTFKKENLMPSAEQNAGIIIFVGGDEAKSMHDFDGIYGGGGYEQAWWGASEHMNKNSVSVQVFRNLSTGTFAVVVMKSQTGGANPVSINAQFMSVNTFSSSGAGTSLSDLLNDVKGNFVGVYETASAALANVMKRAK